MKALDAYKDVLRELDKYESPSFSIADFNYFFNKAISRYIDLNYRSFDILQKDIDDLRWVATLGTERTLASGVFTLPDDYRHVLHLKVKMTFIKNVGSYRTGTSYDFYPERFKSGQKGLRYKDAFSKPNHKRLYYELTGSTLKLIYDATLHAPTSGINAWLDYVKQPTDVYLNPDEASNYSDVANNSLLAFATGTSKNHVYYEIVNTCRAVFLENIESPRAAEALRESMT